MTFDCGRYGFTAWRTWIWGRYWRRCCKYYWKSRRRWIRVVQRRDILYICHSRRIVHLVIPLGPYERSDRDITNLLQGIQESISSSIIINSIHFVDGYDSPHIVHDCAYADGQGRMRSDPMRCPTLPHRKYHYNPLQVSKGFFSLNQNFFLGFIWPALFLFALLSISTHFSIF